MSSAGLCGATPSSRASRCGQGDRLQRLAGPDDPRVVALGEQLVQRAVLEVARQQAREAGRGQEHLLEQEGLAVGHAQPLEVDDRGADRDVERLGDGGAGGDRSSRRRAGRRVVAAALDLLGEGHRAVEVEVDRGRMTKVPRPRVRSRRRSRARSPSARRTVIRLQP